MKALLYGIALQWKLDIRSKTLLITCYMVPLLFFAIMGGIFTSIMPESKDTLVPAMTVMGIHGRIQCGLPPSLVEIYGSGMKKVYKANGIPVYFGLLTTTFSAMIHLLLMSVMIYAIAPFAFGAKLPNQSVFYFISLIIFIMISLSVGSILGLVMKKQAKVTMISQFGPFTFYYAVRNYVSHRFFTGCVKMDWNDISCCVGLSIDAGLWFWFSKFVAYGAYFCHSSCDYPAGIAQNKNR